MLAVADSSNGLKAKEIMIAEGFSRRLAPPEHLARRAALVPQGYSGYAHPRAAGKLLLAMVEPGVR